MRAASLPVFAHAEDVGSGAGVEDEDDRFDELCRLARQVFDCPTVLVSLVTADEADGGRRLEGLDATFAETVLATELPLVVTDARADPRYAKAFLVVAYPFVRFYAGVPLTLSGGTVAGVFSLIGYQPRPTFGTEEVARLETFGRLAAGELERRISEKMRRQAAAQFDLLVEGARTPVLEVDEGGRILRANRAVELLTGAEKDGLVRAPVNRLLAGIDAAMRRTAELAHVSSGPQTVAPRPVDLVTLRGAPLPHLAYVSCWYEAGRVRWRIVLEPAG